MKALRWIGERDVRVEDVERPRIEQPDDAIVRVTTAAICGSDLHVYTGKVPKVAAGTVLGHEFAGVVEEVGPACRLVKPGGRFFASMYVACGRCPSCVAGKHTRCSSFAIFGMGDLMGGLQGGQAEHVRVPIADMTLFPIPDGTDDEDVLFVGDILATAYTACVAAAIQPGEVVAIVGAGPVGLLAISCAQLFTPSQIFAIDLMPDRLAMAEARGAIPIDASSGDPLGRLRELTGRKGADVVLEVVGSKPALETAWRVADTGARIILVGLLVSEEWPESAGRTWLRNLSITTITGQAYSYRESLVRLIRAGRLHPRSIVSERVPLVEAAEAYQRMHERKTFKPLLKP
jgi:threonine dehydrogenase-like Zn-dependent dehydrogenase